LHVQTTACFNVLAIPSVVFVSVSFIFRPPELGA